MIKPFLLFFQEKPNKTIKTDALGFIKFYLVFLEIISYLFFLNYYVVLFDDSDIVAIVYLIHQ
ncbi:MAG: hypothetical protein ACI4T9_01255, partial [Prevotella sp.]